MPFLDANALDDDPEGMAFLQSVLTPAKGRRRRKPVGFALPAGTAPTPAAPRRRRRAADAHAAPPAL